MNKYLLNDNKIICFNGKNKPTWISIDNFSNPTEADFFLKGLSGEFEHQIKDNISYIYINGKSVFKSFENKKWSRLKLEHIAWVKNCIQPSNKTELDNLQKHLF